MPELPSFEQFWKQGIAKYKVKEDTGITMQSFRTDPAKHPLKTPSGKIEIYSEQLVKLAQDTDLPKAQGQVIRPIPTFIASHEMVGQGDKLEKKYPLECYGFHGQGHVHSSYANLDSGSPTRSSVDQSD